MNSTPNYTWLSCSSCRTESQGEILRGLGCSLRQNSRGHYSIYRRDSTKHKSGLSRLGAPGHRPICQAPMKPAPCTLLQTRYRQLQDKIPDPISNVNFSDSDSCLYSLTNHVCSSSFTDKLWLASNATSVRPRAPWSPSHLWSLVFYGQQLAPGHNTHCPFHSGPGCHGDHLRLLYGNQM